MESLQESSTIPLEKVQLSRRWTFWENYDTKDKKAKVDYSNLLKPIYTFNNLIEFWQFWNIYPGNDPSKLFFNGERLIYFFKEQYRIVAMNLFTENIRPEWEDENNKGGNVIVMEYLVDRDLNAFIQAVQSAWTKLMLSLIGENLPFSEKVNGIRFVDKTKNESGKKIIFRFEVWISKEFPENELELTKVKMGKDLGCPGVSIKKISG